MPSTSETYNLNCSSLVVCGIIKIFSFSCMWEAFGFQHPSIDYEEASLRGQCLIRGTRRVHAHCGDKHSRLSEMGWFNTQTLQLSQVRCQGNRPRGSLTHRKFTKDASGLTSTEGGMQQDWERLAWVAGVTKASADPKTGSSELR